MSKPIFTLAVTAMLTACGGAGSSSDTPAQINKTVSSATSYKVDNASSNTVILNRVEVEGSSDKIGSTAQIHANMDDGKFDVITAAQYGPFADEDAELRLILTNDNVSTQDVLNGDATIYAGVVFGDLDQIGITQDMRAKCRYKSLSNITCGGIKMDVSKHESAIPAEMKLHMLSCNGRENVCERGISVRLQFN